MAMIYIDNAPLKDPSAMAFKFCDISQANSGRTQAGKMLKNKVTDKVTITLKWNQVTPAETADILTKTSPEYMDVTFIDPRKNAQVKKRMYRSDVDTPVQIWTVNNKRYSQVGFELIEQ
jgi:hypothetical protein